jgi:hypothetical protein
MRFARPEDELIHQCARTYPGESRVQQILQQEIDWTYIIDSTVRNRVVALVFQHLKPHLPEAHTQRVQSYLQFSMQHNLLLTAQLIQILDAFRRRDIAILPFKGPVLATLVYQNLTLREFSDVDVLIHRADLQQAKDALQSLGFVPEVELQGRVEERYIEDKHHYLFQHADHMTLIELHWSLADSQFSLLKNEQSFWENARVVDFQNTQILTPSDEDMLIYLCNHGYRHEWERLSWIVDVAWMLDTRKCIDWDYVIDHAERLRSRQKLALGLHLARTLASSELPAEVLDLFPPTDNLEKLMQRTWDLMFMPERSPELLADGMSYHYALIETWGDRFRYYRHYIRRRLTPNREDEGVVQLPPRLKFLYFFVRVYRLARIYGLAVLKTVFARH